MNEEISSGQKEENIEVQNEETLKRRITEAVKEGAEKTHRSQVAQSHNALLKMRDDRDDKK